MAINFDWKDKPTLTISQAAELLGISRSLAFKLAHTGEIPVIRLGQRRMVVPTAAVVRMLERAVNE